MNEPPRPFTPEAVHSCLRNRNWQLVGPHKPAEWERFLDDVAGLLSAGETTSRPAAERLERAVTGAYCIVLYAACAAHGTYDQHRAYTEVWKWVYSVIARRVNDPYDREDIAQEVLLFVFQNLQQVNRQSGFLAWVGGVADKRIKRHYAKLGDDRRRLIYDIPDEDADEPNPIIPATDTNLLALRLEKTEVVAEMLAILDKCLPPKARTQKIVFIDLILHQRSVTEISQKRSLTVEAVHTAWSRVRHALQNGCAKIIEKLILYLELQDVSYAGEAP